MKKIILSMLFILSCSQTGNLSKTESLIIPDSENEIDLDRFILEMDLLSQKSGEGISLRAIEKCRKDYERVVTYRCRNLTSSISVVFLDIDRQFFYLISESNGIDKRYFFKNDINGVDTNLADPLKKILTKKKVLNLLNLKFRGKDFALRDLTWGGANYYNVDISREGDILVKTNDMKRRQYSNQTIGVVEWVDKKMFVRADDEK